MNQHAQTLDALGIDGYGFIERTAKCEERTQVNIAACCNALLLPGMQERVGAVSYTHLTLPTIYSV